MEVKVSGDWKEFVNKGKDAIKEVQDAATKIEPPKPAKPTRSLKDNKDQLGKMSDLIDRINKKYERGHMSLRKRNKTLKQITKKLREQNRLIEKQQRIRRRLLASGKLSRKASNQTNTIIKRQGVLHNQNLLAIKKAGGAMGGMAGSASGLLAQIKGFAPQFAAAALAAQALRAAFDGFVNLMGSLPERQRELDSLRMALKSYLDTQAEVNYVINKADSIANKYGVSVDGVNKAYKRIGPTMAAAGYTLADTDAVITALTARTTSLGLNAEQTGRYMETFAQVMGKGKLQGEELTQQFAELDGALRTQIEEFLASEYGLDNLAEAMSEGAVTADMFAHAMVSISGKAVKELAIDWENLNEQIASMDTNQLENIFTNLFRLMQDQALEAFKPWIDGLNNVKLAFMLWAASFSERFPMLSKLFQNLGYVIQWSLEMAVMGIGMILDLTLQLIENFIKMATETEGWGRAWKAVRTFGISEGVRAIAGNMDGLKESMEGARDKARAMNGQLGLTVEELRKIKAAKDAAKIDEEGRKAENIAKAMEKLNRKMSSVRKTLEGYKLDATNAAGATFDFSKKLKTIQNDLKNTAISAEDTSKAILDLAKDMKASRQAAIDNTYDAAIKGIENEYDGVKEKIDAQVDAIDKAIAKENERKKVIQNNAKIMEMNLARQKELATRAHDKQIQEIKKEMEAEKMRHAQAMSFMDAEEARINAKYDAEDARARKPSAAEKKLTDLEKAELRRQARNSKLTEQERLQAQAKLDQMQREEKLAQNKAKRAQELAQLEKKRAAAEEQHKTKMAELEKEEEEKQDKKKKMLEGFKDLQFAIKRAKQEGLMATNNEVEALKKKKADLKDALDKAKKTRDAKKKIAENTKEAAEAANTLAGNIDNVTQNLSFAVTEADALKRSLAQAAIDAQKIQTGSAALPPPRFAGGPVKGGQQYTVNELGQEGFLSSSGRLSAIKSPAWGTWRAPGAGEVVPAHIFSRLEKGINNNLGPGRAASSVRKVATVTRAGDSIQNNVTIQATNPRAVAGDVMVQLTKLKRLRYGR